MINFTKLESSLQIFKCSHSDKNQFDNFPMLFQPRYIDDILTNSSLDDSVYWLVVKTVPGDWNKDVHLSAPASLHYFKEIT